MLHASKASIESYYDDVESLWCQHRRIQVLEQPPSSLEFLSKFVMLSRPCLILNAVMRNPEGCPLILTLDEIVANNPDLPVVVDASPDGYADALRLVRTIDDSDQEVSTITRMFVKPEERQMTIEQFRQRLRLQQDYVNSKISTDPSHIADSAESPRMQRVFETTRELTIEMTMRAHGEANLVVANDEQEEEYVLYYSRQNDCLRNELPALWDQAIFPASFSWADEVFCDSDSSQRGPQAINLWIGNEHATSSMHKDHYENLFYVLSGEKIFTLCPPADAPFLYEHEHESGAFTCVDGQWRVNPDVEHGDHASLATSKVRWVAANPIDQDTKSFPLVQYTHPMQVRVPAGSMLYLPSLWFHEVTQSCETVAINYWYEMKFESPLWTYFHLVQQLNECLELRVI